MHEFDPSVLKSLYVPPADSHKGQNGKILIIAGSTLFHAASIWPLTVASRIVDMVFYSSVPQNNELIQKAKEDFKNGIVVPREKLDDYIREADVILIGPGLPRPEGQEPGEEDTKLLTERLLISYPDKRWVLDGGSLQTIEPEILLGLNQMPILTPHQKEYETLLDGRDISEAANTYHCVILKKGVEDVIASPDQTVTVSGGNAGMTKGGTGDVLAGLAASLYCKNEAFLAACAASYINKKAGESLEKKVGLAFNASDLANEIPYVMKGLQ
ncbi:MAG: NAD(P)H-hydrate dehydratase [Candidatus Levyibacteriota bacterium]